MLRKLNSIVAVTVFGALLLLGGLGTFFVAVNRPPDSDGQTPEADVPWPVPLFREVAREAGVEFRHTRDASFFNLGGGAAAADFNNDGWVDIYVTNSKGPNALYRNSGDGTFRDVGRLAGIADGLDRGHGAAWGDFDNDGLLDLYVATWGGSRLFRNNGNETFRDVTTQAGVADLQADYRTTGAVWGDYDADGFLDLLVVRHIHSPNEEWEATGIQANLLNRCRTQEFLKDPRVPRGVVVMDPKIVEVRPDLRRNFSRASRPLQLFHNTGDGTFADATDLLGDINKVPGNLNGVGFKPAFLDYDDDGDLDIYVVNDFGVEHYPNVLWRNDGVGENGSWRFADVSVISGANAAMYGMGLAAGDYDNDGDLDFYITDMGPSRFFENRGGLFVDITERTGTGRGRIPENGEVNLSIGWGASFVDVDNDGWLDLYYVAGYLDSDPCMNLPNQPNALFMNRGDGTFADVSRASKTDDAGIGREVVIADFNNDGRMDLYVVNLGTMDLNLTPGYARLYLNADESGNSWLQVRAESRFGNRFAIGAKVTVTVDGVRHVQHVGLGQGHMSQSVTPLGFGLGQATRAEVVEVRWPSGAVHRLTDVALNQVVRFVEPESSALGGQP